VGAKNPAASQEAASGTYASIKQDPKIHASLQGADQVRLKLQIRSPGSHDRPAQACDLARACGWLWQDPNRPTRDVEEGCDGGEDV